MSLIITEYIRTRVIAATHVPAGVTRTNLKRAGSRGAARLPIARPREMHPAFIVESLALALASWSTRPVVQPTDDKPSGPRFTTVRRRANLSEF